MAWIIGDSFDFYSATTDLGTHWDSIGTFNLTTGRFASSRAIGNSSAGAPTVALVRSSGSNDQTHHIVFSYEQTSAITGAVQTWCFTLSDGATDQCSVTFRTDGIIQCRAGNRSGTILGTYNSAFAANVWYGFEVEIKIDNTNGEFHIRRNGNTVDDFTLTAVDTQASANAYANKLSVVFSTNAITNNNHIFDDLLWFSTSGSAPNTWVGDVRSVQLMPVSDASAQFSKLPTTYAVGGLTSVSNANRTANTVYCKAYTATASGTMASISLNVVVGFTGNLRCGLYASDGTTPAAGPGTVLGTTNAITNPTLGSNTFTFASPPTVVKNTVYWLALQSDTTFTSYLDTAGSGIVQQNFAQAYASGLPTNPSWTTNSASGSNTTMAAVITPFNANQVNETLQDGLTSYVFDSVVGHADLYNVADLPSIPASVIGLVTRGYVAKSDAGAKSAQLQLKSGATTVQSTTLVLSTSFVYTSRVDTTDPNTSAAWTPAAVNAIQIGPYVTA